MTQSLPTTPLLSQSFPSSGRGTLGLIMLPI